MRSFSSASGDFFIHRIGQIGPIRRMITQDLTLTEDKKDSVPF